MGLLCSNYELSDAVQATTGGYGTGRRTLSSLAIIGPETRSIADGRLHALGLDVTFGRHVEEMDAFASSSIEARVEDLHDAFADPGVAAILIVIGGYNSNSP